VVGTSASEKIGDEGAGLGDPLLVSRLGLEVGDGALVLIIVGGEAALG